MTELGRAVRFAQILAAFAVGRGEAAVACELLDHASGALDEDEAGEGDPADIAAALRAAVRTRAARVGLA